MAARLYSPEDLGVGAALISTMTVLASIAQLNLGSVLNRFLPATGGGARRLIVIVYAAAVPAALVASAVFLLGIGLIAPPLAFVAENGWTAIWFALSVTAWTVFALQDSALAGLRKSVWVPVENAGYAVAKIVLLVLMTGLPIAALGPFAAWTLPLVVVIALVNVLIFGRLLPERERAAAPTEGLDRRLIARFFGWDYLGMVAMMAANGIAPILVLRIAGAAANAKYQIAETIAYSLYLMARSMGISLLAEGAANRARLHALAADALTHMAIPLAAGVAVILAAAPLIMALFGSSYVGEGTAILRVLALSTIPWAFTTIRLSVARAEGRTLLVAIVQSATLIIVLTVGLLLLGRMGAVGMALGWLAAQCAVATGIAATAVWKGGPDRAIEWLIDIASSTARLVAVFARPAKAPSDALPDIRGLLEKAHLTSDVPIRSYRVLASQSDCRTIVLNPDNLQAVPLLYKAASSAEGIGSIERMVKRLWAFTGDPRLSDTIALTPEILAIEQTEHGLHLLERRFPGQDGRAFVHDERRRPEVLGAAARTIAAIHGRTIVPAALSKNWLADWIDDPIAALSSLPPITQNRRRHDDALERLRSEQHAFWHRRRVALGWGHGDFSLGNIIIEPIDGDDGQPRFGVSGIVDWEQARPDTPAGLDICNLAITTRSLVRGEEIGQTVRMLLHSPRWEPEERAWMASASSAEGNDWLLDFEATRAMVALAWLRHVHTNIAKSHRYVESRLWAAANVDWVLRHYSRDGQAAR